MLPTVVARRWRVNVSGVVTPSPVGVAMLKLKYPSPPLPSPAMLAGISNLQRRSLNRGSRAA